MTSRCVSFVAMLLMLAPMLAMANPQVTDVRATQRPDGSGLVDIYYNLSGGSGQMTVSVTVSPDNGATWDVTPSPEHLSGAVGAGVTNGTNRHIVWNAGADRPDVYWPQFRVRITAVDSSAGGAEITIMLPGGVPLVMVRIPAGSFVMGSPPDERGRMEREGPQTHVTLTQDFYLGKYPVTQAQWAAVMGEEWPHLAFPGRPNNPVEMVNWHDAQDFITALNAHISATGQGAATMRLPTEAEWEYAARAGTTTRFYFGDSLSVGDGCLDDGIRSQYMWYCGNSASPNQQPQPVGQKLPNAFGLYDMHGNVWEWVQDWYTRRLPGGSVTDPTGPSAPSAGSYRVIRGGGWKSSARFCRSAERDYISPRFPFDDLGFRLASVR